MGFDQLPSRLGPIPEYRPITVTQLPKPSIWPGIATGVAGLTGTLAKALDPVEKAKRKLGLAQLQFQTNALQDYQSGKIDKSEFYIGKDGLPMRLTPVQKQQMRSRAIRMRKDEMGLRHSEAVIGANQGDPRYTHAQEFESLLPQQAEIPSTAPELMPVEPDLIQPERFR